MSHLNGHGTWVAPWLKDLCTPKMYKDRWCKKEKSIWKTQNVMLTNALELVSTLPPVGCQTSPPRRIFAHHRHPSYRSCDISRPTGTFSVSFLLALFRASAPSGRVRGWSLRRSGALRRSALRVRMDLRTFQNQKIKLRAAMPLKSRHWTDVLCVI